MLALLGLLISLTLLLFSAVLASKYLEDAIENLGFSQSFLAVTVGALGTSLAEISSAFFASLQKELSSAVVYGNILGSVVFNSTVIPAVVLTFGKKLEIPRELFVSVVFLLLLYLLSLNSLSFLDVLLLLALYLTYLKTIKPIEDTSKKFHPLKGLEALIYAFAGVLAVVISASLVSKFLQAFARSTGLEALGMLIGMSTSLPELVLAYSMAKRRRYEFGLIEALSSNIANVALVPLLPALIAPLPPAPTSFLLFAVLSLLILLFSLRLSLFGPLLLLITFLAYLLMLSPKVL